MAESHVLVVDDDPHIVFLVEQVLRRENLRTVGVADGRAAMRAFYERRPSLVVLDIDMPTLDGWGVLDRVREISEVPVLMLTANALELEKVRALHSGADDYVTKPFGVAELAARVRALLRRAGGQTEASEVVHDGRVLIDYPNRHVAVDERPVQLTPLEFKLLSAFVQHPNQVLSQQQLLKLVWDQVDVGIGSSDQVRVYVGYLRRKLRDVGEDRLIETVRGFGYRYVPVR